MQPQRTKRCCNFESPGDQIASFLTWSRVNGRQMQDAISQMTSHHMGPELEQKSAKVKYTYSHTNVKKHQAANATVTRLSTLHLRTINSRSSHNVKMKRNTHVPTQPKKNASRQRFSKLNLDTMPVNICSDMMAKKSALLDLNQSNENESHSKLAKHLSQA
mmetsp:Transcript_67402/g.124051  ORF Transcript_67402/g.124051 Transcript_67402/m.124051 type:complete len:161 (+) Transcript_67402:678-1160(+)